MEQERVIEYYKIMRQQRSTQHDHKEICAWAGLVMYVLFAGALLAVKLPEFKWFLIFFVIVFSILSYRYISNQLKLKDIAGAQSGTASIYLSELISVEKNDDELKEYLEIKNDEEFKKYLKEDDIDDCNVRDILNFQSSYAYPSKFLKDSMKFNKKGRGFQDMTRFTIYGFLLLVTFLMLSIILFGVSKGDEIFDLPQTKMPIGSRNLFLTWAQPILPG